MREPRERVQHGRSQDEQALGTRRSVRASLAVRHCAIAISPYVLAVARRTDRLGLRVRRSPPHAIPQRLSSTHAARVARNAAAAAQPTTRRVWELASATPASHHEPRPQLARSSHPAPGRFVAVRNDSGPRHSPAMGSAVGGLHVAGHVSGQSPLRRRRLAERPSPPPTVLRCGEDSKKDYSGCWGGPRPWRPSRP